MADPISYFEFAGPDAAGLARFLIPPMHVLNVIDFALFEDPQGNRTAVVL
jgi:hypothetical protein